MRTGESGRAVSETDPEREARFVPAETLRRWTAALPAAGEALLSRPGLTVLFFLVAGLFATAGWLRPPLSPDLRGFHLPLGLWESASPEELLRGSRPIAPDGIGVLLLALAGGGLAAVLWRPAFFGRVAGLLLAAALAGNAAAAFNHPALVELMDLEFEQRRQIIGSVDIPTMQEDPLATRDNGRVGETAALAGDEQRGDLMRGLLYLLHGRWLVLWAAVGILLGGTGSLSCRLQYAGRWAVFGLLLAGAVCGRRLIAEASWAQAVAREGEGDYEGSDRALRAAISWFPECECLERTWLLGGKLDHRCGRTTPRARFFRAYQLARDRSRPRAVAFREDLPWVVPHTADYREGLAPWPSGLDRSLAPGSVGSGTEDIRRGYNRPEGAEPTVFATDPARDLEQGWALALTADLVGDQGPGCPAVLHQAARLWGDAGLTFYHRGALFKSGDRIYFEDSRCLGVAEVAWRRGFALVPADRSCQYFLGMTWAGADPYSPERAEAAFRPLLAETADRALQADILSNLADAFFRAGSFAEARRLYAESFDRFNMPQIDRINYRAQRRLGGL